MPKWVYQFNSSNCEGNVSQKHLLGGKGANLAEMGKLGLPVPPGFTITTEVCTEFYKNNQKYPSDLKVQVDDAIRNIEKILGKNFGDENNPLLVSVRSGARVSMPGMMDTVLNLGLNDKTVQGLITKRLLTTAIDALFKCIATLCLRLIITILKSCLKIIN